MLENLPPLEAIQAEIRRRAHNKIASYFPDTGAYRRELYPKHMEFIRGGAEHRERAFIAANRIGKSDLGAYEVATHLTGRYPHWWNGKRFKDPVQGWAAGNTSKTVHIEILQPKLLGLPGAHGTGMIPGETIRNTTARPGLADAVETIYVRHVSGGTSILTLKSYEQGRESFEGSAKHFIWLDEEPPRSIYTECLLRTMTTEGIVLLTFTPLNGMSDVVLDFFPSGKLSGDQ